MIDPTGQEPQAHEFREVAPEAQPSLERLDVDHLKGVRLTITAHLGKCSMLVREVLDLKRGSIVQLDKLAGEMTDIFVNGLPLARGEVVVIADVLHVRIAEIAGGEEKPPEEEVGQTDDEELA